MIRLPRTILFASLLVTIVTIPAPWARSQDERPHLRLATKSFEPFVIQGDDGKFDGFSIDLWQELALDLGFEYEWAPKKGVEEILEAVRAGEADAAIAGITINSRREERVDFSYPMFFESGLQILVSSEQETPLLDTLRAFFTPQLLEILATVAVGLFVSAHLLWAFERRKNPQMFPKGYLRGLWEAFWWAIVTFVTVGYGDKVPLGVPGRLVAIVWMLVGVVLVSYFTATVTTSLTVQELEGRIRGPEDLPGKRIATVKETTSADFLQARGLKTLQFDRVDIAYDALRKGTVDAVVYDAPVLRYYAANQGLGSVRVVGQVFAKQRYGIAFPEGSPFREPVNRALMSLYENGGYDRIHAKWFGTDY